MPEQFPTKWDIIVWAGTHLDKTTSSDWQKEKEEHSHAWVIYDNFLKVLETNLSPGEDTNEQNVTAFNTAEPYVYDTITSWYNTLSELYRFLPATHKDAGETCTRDRWRAKLPQHVLSELRRWDPTQVAKQPLKEILAHLDAIIDPEPFRNLIDSKRERRPRSEYSDRSTTRTLYYDKASSTTETPRQTFLTRGRGNNRRGGRDQSKNPNYLPVVERTTTTTT